MIERLLDEWDLVLLVILASVLTVYLTVSDLRKKPPNYAAVTAYAVVATLLLLGISQLRSRMQEYASVSSFLNELASFGGNQFAEAKLKDLGVQLQSFRGRHMLAGSTAESLEELARSFEAVEPGMLVTVVNPAPLYRLPVARVLCVTQTAALRRGVQVEHFLIESRASGVITQKECADPAVKQFSVPLEDASTLDAFRRYGSGTVFSFGQQWFVEVNVLSSGAGESVRAQLGWGDDWGEMRRMVRDLRELVARLSTRSS